MTQGLVLISVLGVYRMIAAEFGSSGIGEYSLVRRALGLLQPLLLLGLGVGLPRYIAISTKEKRGSYARAAVLVAGVTTIIAVIAINLFKNFFAGTFFGNAEFTNYIFPLSVLLAASNFQMIVYCYLQGRLLSRAFNLLQIISLSLIPIAVLVILRGSSLPLIISATSYSIIAVSLAFSVYLIGDFINVKGKEFKSSLKELFVYSVGRLPGDFILAAIISLPPIIAAHYLPVANVGYLAVGQTVTNAFAAIVGPLGIVLLPKVSEMISSRRDREVQNNIGPFLAGVLQCSAFICFQVAIFADFIIFHWLGPGFSAAVPLMYPSVVAAFFYIFYISMRSVIDAAVIKPVNTINLTFAFLFFCFASTISILAKNLINPLNSLNFSFAASIVLLGFLTYLSLHKLYIQRHGENLMFLFVSLLLNCALAVPALFAKPFVDAWWRWMVLEGVLGGIYVAVLFYSGTPWVRLAFSFVFSRKKNNPGGWSGPAR